MSIQKFSPVQDIGQRPQTFTALIKAENNRGLWCRLGQRPKTLKAHGSSLSYRQRQALPSQGVENIYKKLNQELFVFIFSNFIEQKCLRIVYYFYRPL